MFRGKRPKIQVVDERFKPTKKHRTKYDNDLPCPKALTGRARELWFSIIRHAPINFMHTPAATMFCFLMQELEEKGSRMQAAKLGHLKSVAKELGLIGRRARMPLSEQQLPGAKYFNDDFDPGAA